MAGMATGRHRKCSEKNKHPRKHQWTGLHHIGDFEFGVYPLFKPINMVVPHNPCVPASHIVVHTGKTARFDVSVPTYVAVKTTRIKGSQCHIGANFY